MILNMDYKLEDLIDIPLLQDLQEKLNSVYSFPSSIIDNEGKVLTAVAWQDICTKFHRVNPECEKECIKSDKYILEHIHEADPAVSYKCPHGLIDNATPIIIDGKHLGNFFTGQFFLEKPNLEFFRKQAKKYGFDEEEYLEAVKKVPVWTKEKLNLYLDFIKGFIEIIASIGLNHLNEIKSNRAIKERDEKNQAIIRSTSDWIWEVDKNGRYTYCSERIEQVLGYQVNEILGKTPFDLMPPDESERVSKIFRKIVETKSSIVDLENWNLHKEGHSVCLLTNGLPVLDDSGNLKGYIGADKDITKRKLTENLLLEDKERLQIIFDTLSEGVALNEIVYNDSGEMVDYRILEVNKAFYKIADFNKNEVVIGNLATKLYSIEKEFIKEFWQQHKTNKQTVSTEYLSPLNKRWFNIMTSPFKDDKFVTSFQDITKQKSNEKDLKENLKYLEKLNNSLVDVVFTVKLTDRKIIYVNNSVKEVFGYSPEECYGKNTGFLYPDEEAYKQFGQKLQEAIKNDKEFLRINHKLTRKNGEIFTAEITTTFLKDQEEIKEVISIVTDISERVKAEEELYKYQNQLEKLVNERTAELEEKNRELEEFNNLFVGREFRIKELKDKVRELEKKLSGDNN
ncbi:MAG: PocR ligand-binding domain-containing protein [Prolixibacteraceae bacterium]|nr:PocR ligand-binding domain-containing protein [Prolixibacteraceae bacterium]MBN2774837.1 PocR ligand-binding domain-containing protein [Prolixibacteraceae bacterium]